MAKLQTMRGLQVRKKGERDEQATLAMFFFPLPSMPVPFARLSLFLSPCPFLSSLALPPPTYKLPQVFISDIRAATNKEAEQTRVEKELAKIRKKFATGTAVTGEF